MQTICSKVDAHTTHKGVKITGVSKVDAHTAVPKDVTKTVASESDTAAHFFESVKSACGPKETDIIKSLSKIAEYTYFNYIRLNKIG